MKPVMIPEAKASPVPILSRISNLYSVLTEKPLSLLINPFNNCSSPLFSRNVPVNSLIPNFFTKVSLTLFKLRSQ